MYKPIDKLQHSFLDFNQPLGLHMNPDNRWIKLADRIPVKVKFFAPRQIQRRLFAALVTLSRKVF